jgi:hypothetical protein
MKIFPEIDYLIRLNNDSMSAIPELKKRTLSKNFVAKLNNQV